MQSLVCTAVGSCLESMGASMRQQAVAAAPPDKPPSFAPASDPREGFVAGKYILPSAEQEEERMRVLRELDVLDTAAEAAFDNIVEWGRRHFGTPICLVTLVDNDRQWFKGPRRITTLPACALPLPACALPQRAHEHTPPVSLSALARWAHYPAATGTAAWHRAACYGLDVDQTGRDAAFCGHAIMPGAPAIFEVPNTLTDRRFAYNPLVTGAPHIRYYAGAPLRSAGKKLGTLCIIDTRARPPLNEEQRQDLVSLAAMVSDQLTSRLQSKKLQNINEQLYERTAQVHTMNQELNSLIDNANAPIFAVDIQRRVTVWNRKISEMTSIRPCAPRPASQAPPPHRHPASVSNIPPHTLSRAPHAVGTSPTHAPFPNTPFSPAPPSPASPYAQHR